MIILYRHPSGAGDCRVLESAMPDHKWYELREAAIGILGARGKARAIESLRQINFRLSDGTNFFGDDFMVLDAVVPLDQYVALSALENDPGIRSGLAAAADVLSEIGSFVRFAVVRLNASAPTVVELPEPRLTVGVVERALKDAEHLLEKSGATSAIDRAHTALHGYMRLLCEEQSISAAADASVTQLMKALREGHSAMHVVAHDQESNRVIQGLATVIDALNTLRNRASLAHPNQHLLDSAEAVLSLNAIRTVFHYLDMKTSPRQK